MTQASQQPGLSSSREIVRVTKTYKIEASALTSSFVVVRARTRGTVNVFYSCVTPNVVSKSCTGRACSTAT